MQARFEMTDSVNRELEVLERIHNSRYVKQRDIAHVLGISLGMTNAIIKRLVKKGMLTIKKINNRRVDYSVSAAGLDEIARRSYQYVRSTVKYVVDYRHALEDLVQTVLEAGYERIVLVGRSDLDFVIENACSRFDIPLVTRRGADSDSRRGDFTLYSERKRPPTGQESSSDSAHLAALLSAWHRKRPVQTEDWPEAADE
jgi:DNA-binding MarR family transcriptional regulator